MSGGGGGSGNDGSNDMQVSGMEAAMSTEKGISTHAESSVGRGSNQGNVNDEFGTKGNVYDSGADTSTVGIASDNKNAFGTPANPPGVTTNFDYEGDAYNVKSKSFDYETDAYRSNVNIDSAYGPGKITSAVYDPKTGKTKIEQTVGIIDTATYQTANLQAYLDSPDVSDKDKVNTLNRIQALSNSNLKGSKLNKVQGLQTTKDFVVENLDLALGNLKSQSKNDKYTSQIDANATTKAADLSNKPIDTIISSGGILGTAFSQLTDHYNNNKALETLGYTGKVSKEGSGDAGDSGNKFLTGVQDSGDRDAMNQLAPSAPFIQTGTKKIDSVAAKFFGNSANNFQFDFQSEYTKALAKQKALLNKGSQIGLLAVNQSPFYDFLKKNNIDKGIL